MVTVNGTPIDDDAIAREAQYHPAATVDEAMTEAARSLVVRHLLLERAAELGIDEGNEEETVKALMDREIIVPLPDMDACHRYYDANTQRFRRADVFQAAHILLPAAPSDTEGRATAKEQAKALISLIQEAPARFAELARLHSACASRDQGGDLGLIGRGDTNPEFETFLMGVDIGLCPVPVASRHGIHVLRLDHRAMGEVLPFEAVAAQIADYLAFAARTRASAQYVQLLVGRARVTGITLPGADSPLVQ